MKTAETNPGMGASPDQTGFGLSSYELRDRELNRGIEALITSFIDFNLPKSHRIMYEKGAAFKTSFVTSKDPENTSLPLRIRIEQVSHPRPAWEETSESPFIREILFISYSEGETIIKASAFYTHEGLKTTRVQAIDASGEKGLEIAKDTLQKAGLLPSTDSGWDSPLMPNPQIQTDYYE